MISSHACSSTGLLRFASTGLALALPNPFGASLGFERQRAGPASGNWSGHGRRRVNLESCRRVKLEASPRFQISGNFEFSETEARPVSAQWRLALLFWQHPPILSRCIRPGGAVALITLANISAVRRSRPEPRMPTIVLTDASLSA